MEFPFFHKEKSLQQIRLLNASVFICGAVLMVFELVGSRMFAPYLGTSTYVWTSLIGVILGFLSLGYWYGGKIADQKTEFTTYAWIIFGAGVFILFTFASQVFFLSFFQSYISVIELSSLFSAIVLFAPTSFLLGIVSPYAVRLKLSHLENSGTTIGNLYAISTAGSIFGTFFAGFYLIPHIGTIENLLLLSAILFATAFVLSKNKKQKIFSALMIILVVLSFFLHKNNQAFLLEKFHFLDIDSEYSRIFIGQGIESETGKEIQTISTDPFGTQGAMFLSSNELVFSYTKFYQLDSYFNPNIKSGLMLGGCAYSYPKEFLKRFREATLDVVEIDPTMTKLAKEYFRLGSDPRLASYHEDARTYLNKATKKYDVIYGDAFNSSSYIPFQLTTKEAVQLEYDLLNDNGVILSNLISSIHGDSGKFLRSEYATYKSVFPQVYVIPVTHPADGSIVQNIMLVALKSKQIPDFVSKDQEQNTYLQNKWEKEILNDLPILTDNFAPVDYYKRLSL